jgi:hypothetical protein
VSKNLFTGLISPFQACIHLLSSGKENSNAGLHTTNSPAQAQIPRFLPKAEAARALIAGILPYPPEKTKSSKHPFLSSLSLFSPSFSFILHLSFLPFSSFSYFLFIPSPSFPLSSSLSL